MHPSGLIDSHLHLTDYEPGTDITALLEQTAAAGVSHLMCNGTSEADWPKVLELADVNPQIIPCLGLHPWFVARRSQNWHTILEDYLQIIPCGIGETGLDRLAEPFDQSAQEEAFRIQLSLARKYNRPIMVHCVRAWGWLMDVLHSEPDLPNGFLIHAYGGSVDLIKPLAEMGAYFSFSATVLNENYQRSRKALDAVPLDRLLIETDAPNMLPPQEYRKYSITSNGKEYNHPANLPAILDGIAALLGQSPESLRETLWQNSQRFFRPILIL